MKTIERLREFKPSEGPWTYEPIYWALRMAEKGGDNHVPEDLPKGSKYPCRDDAMYIAEACNALPALLSLVEAQAAEIEAWRTAEEECRAIENACDMNAARAYIAKSRDATDAALRAMEGGE